MRKFKLGEPSASKHVVMGKFPAGPVVGTPCIPCQGLGFNPWSGNYDPRSLAGCAKDGVGEDNSCEGDGDEGNMMVKTVIVRMLVTMLVKWWCRWRWWSWWESFFLISWSLAVSFWISFTFFYFFWCKVTQRIIHVTTWINYLWVTTSLKLN